MANVSRENLKARFKRGMYPTEGDFANLMDSYVHKDDGIDINDVTAENGSKTLTTLLQEFKQEILQDAKDQETQYDDTELKGKVETNENNISSLDGRVSTNENNISSLDGRVSTNEGDISTLKDDLDTAEDNIAGHEIRIKALEERTEVPEGLAEFIEKVNSFLEDSDATDAAINKWKEIEAFLNGITDTETLPGLLADLKQEILDEIPEQKEYTAGDGIEISEDGVISLKEDENKLDCVKVIADLDASNAPTGTVAIYTGESNDKYTHGFVYEKMGEGGGDLQFYFGFFANRPGTYTGESEVQWVNGTSGSKEVTVYKVKIFDDILSNKDKYYWVNMSPEKAKEYAGTVVSGMYAPDGHGIYHQWDRFNVISYEGGEGDGASWQALNVMNVIG